MPFAPVRRPHIVVASFALIVAVAPLARAQQPTTARRPVRADATGRSQGLEGHSPIRAVERRQVVRLRPRAERGRRDGHHPLDRRRREGNEVPDRRTGRRRRRAWRRGRWCGGQFAEHQRRLALGCVHGLSASGDGAGRGGRGGRGGGGGGGARHNGATPAAPAQNKMALVNLATGEKKEFDKVRSFSFNGDKPTYIAMQSYPEQAAPTQRRAGGRRGGRGAAGGGGAAAAGRVDGTDLVLYNLVERRRDQRRQRRGVRLRRLRRIARVHDRRARSDRQRRAASQHAHGRRSRDRFRSRALSPPRVGRQRTGASPCFAAKLDTLSRDTLFSVVSFTNVDAFRRRRRSSSIRRSTPISQPG